MGQRKAWNNNTNIYLILVFIGFSIPATYLAWEKYKTTSFTPQPKYQRTTGDIIGNLGGMEVIIPRICVENVEYDDDTNFGERHKDTIPNRTFSSKLKSFGIDVRIPDMACKKNAELRKDYARPRADSPWISIGVNAGEIYPSLGANVAAYRESLIIKSINKPTDFWFKNYEKLPETSFELDAYVVTGIDPNTGKLARNSEDTYDIFIGHDKTGTANTYIRCGRTYTPGGAASCHMGFSMEPKSKAHIEIRFMRTQLYLWKNIQTAALRLLLSYKRK